MFSYRNVAKHLNITNFYFFMKNTNIQEYLENLFINNIYESNKLLTLEETIEVDNFLCTLEEKLDFIINNTKIKSSNTDELYLLEKFGRRAANVEVIKPNASTEKEKTEVKKLIDTGNSNYLISKLEDYYKDIDCTQKQTVLINSINRYIMAATDVSSNERHDDEFINKLRELKTRTEKFTFQPRLH